MVEEANVKLLLHAWGTQAIVEGNRGTHEGKVRRLREAGAHVVERFDEIPRVTAELLAGLKVEK